MKNLSHKFRRAIQKGYISFKKFTTPHKEKSEYEKDCIAICNKLIKLDGTILLLTPLSDKRYIRNEEHDIFVILENHNVKVINHVYSYTIYLEVDSWRKIISLFDNEVEKRRIEFEKEITSNIKHSLQTILHKI